MVLLVLGTVAILPGALDRFVLVKLALVGAAGAVAFGWARPAGRLPRSVVALVGVGAGWLVVAALVGTDPWSALAGRGPRYEGVLGLTSYVVALGAGARLLGPRASDGIRVLALRCVAVATAAVVGLAVLEALGLRPLETTVERPGSLLGNATDQGAWCCIAFAVLAGVAMAVRDRRVLALAAVAGVGVVLSGSRGALLGLGVALVATWWVSGRRSWRLATGLGVGLAAVALALPGVRDRVSGDDAVAAGTTTGRQLLWQRSLDLASAHPVVGVGPSGFVDGFPAYADAAWYRATGVAQPPDSPHDVVLQSLSAGGIVLGGVLLALVALVVLALRRRLLSAEPVATCLTTRIAVVVAVSYGTVLLTHPTTPGPMTFALAVVGGGIAVQPVAVSRSIVVRDRAVATVSGLVATTLLAAAVAEIPLRVGIEAVAADDLGSASTQFGTARLLRPWDREVPAAAAYALAMAAEQGGGRAFAAEALRWADDVGGGQPGSVPLATARSAAWEALGDRDRARQVLDEALAAAPGHPGLLNRRGVVAAEQGDLDRAERDFRAALAAQPDDPALVANLRRVNDLRGSG